MQANALEGFRLSPQQRHVWALQQDGRAYAARCAVLIEGDVKTQVLRAALAAVVARHEILRTSYHRRPGMKFPFQVVGGSSVPSVTESELTALDARAQNQTIEQLYRAERQQAIDLAQGAGARFTLLTLAPTRRLLFVSLPALCADARSLHNFVGELSRDYAARLRNDDVAAEPLQYIDYCEWQAEALAAETDEAAAGRAFWQGREASFTRAAPQLPWEHDAAAPRQHELELLAPLTLNAESTAQIATVAARRGASVETFLLACWQTLLQRLTGETEIVVSKTFAGRKADELDTAIGLFARALPVATRFAGHTTFGEILDETVRDVSAVEAWQDYFTPAETKPSAASANKSGMARIGFEFATLPVVTTAGGVSFSISKQESYIEQYKLKLSCLRAADTIVVEFAYDPALFAPADMAHLARSFAALVESAVADPETAARRLNVLGEDDRRQVLVEFNQQATAIEPRAAFIQQMFEAHAAAHPTRAAVVSEETRLTFAELNTKANQLAHLLRRRGVRPDSLVGLCLKRSAETVVGLLGILKAGGAYVPLDADSPAARLAQQTSATGLTFLLTQKRFLSKFSDFKGEIICLDRDRALLADEPESNPAHVNDAQQLAYVIFTSGSTGQPKGVGVTHSSLVNYTASILEQLRGADVSQAAGLHFATVSTFTADLGNTCLFPALTSGGCLHVIGYDMATDAARFAAYAAEHPLDVLKITPTHLAALLALPQGAGVLPRKFLLTGGEALSFELLRQVRALAPECAVINHYGPTEATVGCLTFGVKDQAQPAAYATTVPIGRPIAHTQVYILDEHFAPTPSGVAGELYIAGAGLARGYLNQPAQTAERFVPNPFSIETGARMYRTGDRARFLPGGNVEFLGRADHQVKIRGFRVELGEIECALKAHMSVRDAAVLVEEDESSGHKRLIAYVAATARDAHAVGALRGHLKGLLPDYMLPAAFVMLDSLPLTANGKLDRNALQSLGARATQTQTAVPADESHTPAQQVLVAIWQDVLGLEHVGINDNFFDLGGDSILGIQIIARANQAGFQLTPKQLFQHQTIAELVNASGTTPGAAHQQGPVTGDVPLVPLQHWFFERNLSHPDLFSQAMLYEVNATLDAAQLRLAAQHLFAQHDALRLRFVRDGEGWRQFNAAVEEGSVFCYEDLSLLSAAEKRGRVETATAELRAGINLAHGPLARFALFHFGAGEADRLLIVCHYLAVDGFSWRVLLEDLQTLYRQMSNGEQVSLPPKTTSFQAWAQRIMRDAQAEQTRDELDYWLAGARTRMRTLPRDNARGENVEAAVRTFAISLSVEEAEALLREVPHAYHTEIDDALLTALAGAVALWTGERALLVDLESHGRTGTLLEEDLSRTVGRVTHRAPAYFELTDCDSPGDALKSVKEQLRRFRAASPSYGLLRYLSADAETRAKLRALPPAEIYFNYVGQLDQAASSLFPVGGTPEVLAHDRQLVGARPHLLDVSAMIFDGRLQTLWEYSANVYQRATIETLAQGFLAELRALIAHCRSAEAGGYTPSDFPEMDFDQQELDDLIAKLSA